MSAKKVVKVDKFGDTDIYLDEDKVREKKEIQSAVDGLSRMPSSVVEEIKKIKLGEE